MYRKANPKIRTREKTDRFGTAGQERSKENIDVNYADSGGEDTSDRSKQYSDYDIHEDIDEMENDTNIDREMVTEDEAADDDDENDDSDEDDNDSDSDVELLESDDMYFRRFYNHCHHDHEYGIRLCSGKMTGTRYNGVNNDSSGNQSDIRPSLLIPPRSSRYTSGPTENKNIHHDYGGTNSAGTRTQLLKENKQDRYHPECLVVRQRINQMYQLLAYNERFHSQAKSSLTIPANSISPTSSSPIQNLSTVLHEADRSLSNTSDLVDLLIRTHLPQFWRYRSHNKRLNRHRHRPSNNSRPRSWGLLLTCVDCGFKFRKQPVYNETATERVEAKARRQAEEERRRKARNEQKKTLGLPGAERWTNRGSSRGAWRKRKPVSAAVLIKELTMRFPCTKNSNVYNDHACDKSDNDAHPDLTYLRNKHLTPHDLDNIFNNNRKDAIYDGNMDCIGRKEEGHSSDCPVNLTSAAGKATKLYLGWDLVVGFNHSAIPRFPYPQIVVPPSITRGSLIQSETWSISMNSKTLATSPQMPLSQQSRHEAYYPARSLIPAFCHLLPRDVPFTTNQIRKLFTYFVWHPWFDCDFQAMTIRKGYEELWPLFLLRDEDWELTKEEVQEERAKAVRIKKVKRQGTIAKKKSQSDQDVQHGGDKDINKEQGRNKRHCCSDNPIKSKSLQKQPGLQSTSNSSFETTDPDVYRVLEIKVEQDRRRQLEIRFTTSLERSMGNHGVIWDSRHRTHAETGRAARQVRRGWVHGPPVAKQCISDFNNAYNSQFTASSAIDDNGEKPLSIHGRTRIYRANNPAQIFKGAQLAKARFRPRIVYPEAETPHLRNRELTQPDGDSSHRRRHRHCCLDKEHGADEALVRLQSKDGCLANWGQEAELVRRELGFVLPEFARLKDEIEKNESKSNIGEGRERVGAISKMQAVRTEKNTIPKTKRRKTTINATDHSKQLTYCSKLSSNATANATQSKSPSRRARLAFTQEQSQAMNVVQNRDAITMPKTLIQSLQQAPNLSTIPFYNVTLGTNTILGNEGAVMTPHQSHLMGALHSEYVSSLANVRKPNRDETIATQEQLQLRHEQDCSSRLTLSALQGATLHNNQARPQTRTPLDCPYLPQPDCKMVEVMPITLPMTHNECQRSPYSSFYQQSTVNLQNNAKRNVISNENVRFF